MGSDGGIAVATGIDVCSGRFDSCAAPIVGHSATPNAAAMKTRDLNRCDRIGTRCPSVLASPRIVERHSGYRHLSEIS